MRDTLEAVAQAVGEVVCWIDLPLVFGSVMRLIILGHAIGRNVPHHGVAAFDVLLHTQECCLALVLSVFHIPEFLQVGFNILLGMRATVSWALLAVLAAALELNVRLATVADVGLAETNQFLGEVVELLEIVAGVCDCFGLEACRVLL